MEPVFGGSATRFKVFKFDLWITIINPYLCRDIAEFVLQRDHFNREIKHLNRLKVTTMDIKIKCCLSTLK